MSSMRGYMICASPRCGSNFFCETLISTGVLGRPREYFDGPGRRRREDPHFPDDRRLQIERVLTDGATGHVYGLKIFPGLFDEISKHLRIIDVLPNLKYVRMRRRDIIGQAISWTIATQSNKYRATDVASGEPVYNADAIYTHLRQVCQRNMRWDLYFARNEIQPVEICYEDVIENPQASIDRIAKMMHLENRAIFTPPIPLQIQRDAVNVVWRSRFLEERADPNIIDKFDVIGLN